MLSHRERRILLGIERQLRAEILSWLVSSDRTRRVRRALSAELRLGAGVLALAAAVSVFLGAPEAALVLITFAWE